MGNIVAYQCIDHSGEVLDALDQAIDHALFRIGLQAESFAKLEISKPKEHADGISRPNVDTGLLRNSITFAVSGGPPAIQSYTSDDGSKSGAYSACIMPDGEKAVYVGTNVEYAIFVEMGTRHARAYPFLRPAATEHNDVYKRIFYDEMGKGK